MWSTHNPINSSPKKRVKSERNDRVIVQVASSSHLAQIKFGAPGIESVTDA